MKRAVFLDRDGTLIVDRGYLHHPDQVQLLQGAVPALRSLRAWGFALVVCSNQSGIGRGLLTEAQAGEVHARFSAAFAAHAITFDAVHYCPHGPEDGCSCRKPKPGMLQEAAKDHALNLGRSFMIGDNLSDVEAAHRAGCTGILLNLEKLKPGMPEIPTVASWAECVEWIGRQWSQKRWNAS